jgi:hypothetical protein
MLALFNLGLQELVILGMLGLLWLGIVVAVVLAVHFANRNRGRDDAEGD